ncbi:MAG: Exonuclease RNase T and DNA polymerase III [Candidatus Moranbacteria bacterium GW2011_GWF2_34_56]|nr:MAG: Exonuclease RNase T and DNA polymerase III [Candidatus Moranbacteria bacterium GW2011_GWF2_34_56]
MYKDNLIFLDTETTGLGKEDRLCQVAYKFQGQEKESLLKPPVPIGVESMCITHITNKMVADKEAFIGSEMHKDLEDIFKKDNILVAHNADFDADMLRKEGLVINRIIDTFKIAHYLDHDGRYYFEFEIENATAHNALGDIRVLEVIFDYYYEKMLAIKETPEAAIGEMIKISKEPILLRKFNFGKYNGEWVEDVAKKDANYLRWLLSEKNKARENGEDEDKNWIHTLKYYLNERPTLF